MNEMLKILAVALIGVLAIIITKQTKPEIALLLTIAVSIIVIIMTISKLQSVAKYFKTIIELTGVNSSIFAPLLKVISIGYLAEFGANICIDSGCSSIADKIIFSAKIVILIISMPVIINVIELIVGLL